MWRRVADVFRRRRLDANLDAQWAFHLDALEAESRARGLPPEEARAAARRAMGGLGQVKDAYRDQLKIPSVDTIWQDARYGCRVLQRNPGFSAVALSILAIGIASATTIFSFVDAVLLKPLPSRTRTVSSGYSNDGRTGPRHGFRRAPTWTGGRTTRSSNRWRCCNRVW